MEKSKRVSEPSTTLVFARVPPFFQLFPTTVLSGTVLKSRWFDASGPGTEKGDYP